MKEEEELREEEIWGTGRSLEAAAGHRASPEVKSTLGIRWRWWMSVSYTHLTLPTIYSV